MNFEPILPDQFYDNYDYPYEFDQPYFEQFDDFFFDFDDERFQQHGGFGRPPHNRPPFGRPPFGRPPFGRPPFRPPFHQRPPFFFGRPRPPFFPPFPVFPPFFSPFYPLSPIGYLAGGLIDQAIF